MKAMKPSVLKAMLAKNQECVRIQEGCGGRLTIEHVFGRKHEEPWNCIWLCEKHHGLGQWSNKAYFNKEINRYHAYKQVTDEELTYRKLGQNYMQEKRYLEKKYGLSTDTIASIKDGW